jgi:rod shape determining protein RodA
MVFMFILFVTTMFSSLPRRWIVLTLAILLILAIPGYFLLQDYQRARITSFLNPESDPQGQGYHLIQSRIAVGSGGLTGKGFLRGTQSRGGFIPVIESDFIFALIAEEFGLTGSVRAVPYFLLLARIYRPKQKPHTKCTSVTGRRQ